VTILIIRYWYRIEWWLFECRLCSKSNTWFPALRCRFRNRFRTNRVRTVAGACSAAVVRQAQEASHGVSRAKEWAELQATCLRALRQNEKNLDPVSRNYTSFPPRWCPFGVRKIKFEIWPPLRPKNVKIGTLSWRSMENCSRPNTGTVSRIQFKVGTRIEHPSGITWHDSKVKRSKVKVTT